ncbi:SusC/RagA family TonB-linked outer membrane protein [Tamlana sp. 2_MG-2023]|uniref:SusC/RagA family TonB-linked outer membrane protein n=1 Tax=unclassified Tamlana TaxID=2614803 RepID=UPI0026E464C1|nr:MULTISPECIES: SusC/RagA family TonB-linked outer membrane protein [unclassified Tamlana]MDO6760862.1 SusC/RagA family TonB-linked outer membrane protein [Tamlana sp. 2_MG-2023]MDO6791118.1 SusC/RagA family TonB-linked outer membrane protein [Tamlana sp. 1_MG-2023]
MKTKFSGILTLLLVLVVQLTFAQEKTISGTVSDESGLPLPGASVLVKGTINGTSSDFDGRYSIMAKTGDVLVYSFVGYTTQEVPVTKDQINVVLSEDAQSLDEVIIVGYGTSTKQAFSGTVKEIKAEVLETKNFSNVSQALAGEVAGVNVINTSGQPGTVATVRIRGFGSVNGNRDPLYVVDGVPLTTSSTFDEDGLAENNNALNSINPADIETTTVLKDATATAIYGARGANGVVLITTKSGKAGTSVIETDFKTGVNFQAIPRYDVIKDPNEYVEISWDALKNYSEITDPSGNAVDYANASLYNSQRGIHPTYNNYNITDVSQLIDPTTGKMIPGVTTRYTPENWEDHAFQSSILTEANLKMSGGNDKTRYFSSFGYLDQKGYLNNSNYKRYTTRLNVNHKPKEWLTATANLSYTYDETLSNGQSEDSGSVFWFVDNIPSIYPLFTRDANGDKIEDPYYGGYQYDYGNTRGFGGLTNAIADSQYDRDGNDSHSVNGSFSFKFDITEGLTFETRYGLQYYNRVRNLINNPFYGSAVGQSGSLFKVNTSEITQNFLNMLRYSKTFGNHGLEVLAAFETNQNDYEYASISKNKVVNLENGLDQANNYVVVSSPPTGYSRARTMESYFGQLNYNYNQKYFLTGSVRRDGSSRFYQNKWGTFGSVGAAWVLSNEDFLNTSSTINFLKLKTSYGLVGDEGGVDYYSGQNSYNINNLIGEISLIPNAIEDPNVTWETSKMFQVGVETSAFNNVIDLSVDYYIKNTDALIFDKRLSPSTGEAQITVNDGDLANRGLEFDLTANIINKKDFGLSVAVNGEFLSNEITRMPIEESTGLPKVLDQSTYYGRSEGHSLYDFYMREWAGVDSANGDPLWNQYYFDANDNDILDSGEAISNLTTYQDANPNNTEIKTTTTNVYSDATEKYTGESAIPDLRGAFRLSARYKNFNLSTQFTYSLGGYGYDSAYARLMSNDQVGGNNYHTDMRDRWSEPGDVTNIPRLASTYNITATSTSTRFLTSTDYIALNNASLGYTLPSMLLTNTGLTGVNFSLTADNLFLSSKRAGFNPNTSENAESDTYRYAPLTTVTLGVRVKF